jgi:hypothetical protein
VEFDGDAGTDGNNAVKQPMIFDDRGVILRRLSTT